jgi:cellulose biosynthesis protein BcsQ
MFQYYIDDEFIKKINKHHEYSFVKIDTNSSRYDILNSGKNVVNFYQIEVGSPGIPPFTSPKKDKIVITIYTPSEITANEIMSKFKKRLSLFKYKMSIKDDLNVVSTKGSGYYGKDKKYIESQYMSKEYRMTITK